MVQTRTYVPLLLVAAASLLAFVSPSGALPAVCCPEYWTSYMLDCYRLYGVRLNWTEAEQYCQNAVASFNGSGPPAHLVSVLTQREQDFICKYFDSFTLDSDKPEMWLGVRGRKGNKNFQWSDSSKKLYTNWEEKGQGDDYCSTMSNDPRGTWVDVLCEDPRDYFVCKFHLED